MKRFKELSKNEKIEVLKIVLQNIKKVMRSKDNPKVFICNSILHKANVNVTATDLIHLAQRYSLQHMFDSTKYRHALAWNNNKNFPNYYTGCLWSRHAIQERIDFLVTLIDKMKNS